MAPRRKLIPKKDIKREVYPDLCDMSDKIRYFIQDLRYMESDDLNMISLKLNFNTLRVETDFAVTHCIPKDVRDLMPDGEPRFVFLSYKTINQACEPIYPLCLLFYVPFGCTVKTLISYGDNVAQMMDMVSGSAYCIMYEKEAITNPTLYEIFGYVQKGTLPGIPAELWAHLFQ